MQVRHTKCEKQ